MTAALPVLAGALFAAGTYLVLQRPLARILLRHGADALAASQQAFACTEGGTR